MLTILGQTPERLAIRFAGTPRLSSLKSLRGVELIFDLFFRLFLGLTSSPCISPLQAFTYGGEPAPAPAPGHVGPWALRHHYIAARRARKDHQNGISYSAPLTPLEVSAHTHVIQKLTTSLSNTGKHRTRAISTREAQAKQANGCCGPCPGNQAYDEHSRKQRRKGGAIQPQKSALFLKSIGSPTHTPYNYI